MQDRCMASITIRDVPDDVRDELASRAARTGRSLQEYLRKDLTDLASRPSAETLAARTVDRKNRTGTELPADTILHHLDVDRR